MYIYISLFSVTAPGRAKTLQNSGLHVGKAHIDDDTSHYLSDDPSTAPTTQAFTGQMQQLVVNGNHYFEMQRTGRLRNAQTNAHVDKKEKLVKFPVTFSTTQAYLKTRLKIYSTFAIYFQLKTTQPNGLIIYSGGDSGKDFFAVEILKGMCI